MSTIDLRDGSTTTDRRLDRIFQEDWRTLNHLIKNRTVRGKPVGEHKPRSYTHACDVWLDQGQEGACVSTGCGHELAASPVKVDGVTFPWCWDNIYHPAQHADPWPGCTLSRKCTIEPCPDAYEGTSVLAGVQQLQRMGFITAYDWAIYLKNAVLGIAYHGPAIVGFNWYEGMFDTDAKGFIRPTGRLSGGHCLLAIGVKIYYKRTWNGWWRRTWEDVDLDRSYVILHNSWGQSWGENGRAKITLRDFDTLLNQQGEVCFVVRNGKKTHIDQADTSVPQSVIEHADDDFLEHPDTFTEEDLDLDEETQQMRVLFPDGDASSAAVWEEIAKKPEIQTRFSYSGPGYSGSGRDLAIPDRLRAYGLKVVEVAGWQTRGSSTFTPKGSIDHHTAAGMYGNAPSLGICTNGRSDLPGPLCQVLIGRDNTCYVIASGRANHAGTGSYAGVSGNTNVYGVEHENTGTGSEPWREDQRVTAAKVHAALLHWRRGGFVCQHKEWAPTRKIDKWGQDAQDMRNRVAAAWKQHDNPTTPTEEEPFMFKPGTNIENVVKDCYRKIVGREPESQQVVDTWHWALAVGQGEQYAGLVNGLHYEQRMREDARLNALITRLASAEGKIANLTTASIQLTPEQEQQILSKVYADLTQKIS